MGGYDTETNISETRKVADVLAMLSTTGGNEASTRLRLVCSDAEALQQENRELRETQAAQCSVCREQLDAMAEQLADADRLADDLRADLAEITRQRDEWRMACEAETVLHDEVAAERDFLMRRVRELELSVETLRLQLRHESATARPGGTTGELDWAVIALARSLGEYAGYRAGGDVDDAAAAANACDHYVEALIDRGGRTPFRFAGAEVAIVDVSSTTHPAERLAFRGCTRGCDAHDPTHHADLTCPLNLAYARFMAAVWAGYGRAVDQTRSRASQRTEAA